MQTARATTRTETALHWYSLNRLNPDGRQLEDHLLHKKRSKAGLQMHRIASEQPLVIDERPHALAGDADQYSLCIQSVIIELTQTCGVGHVGVTARGAV